MAAFTVERAPARSPAFRRDSASSVAFIKESQFKQKESLTTTEAARRKNPFSGCL
jgi:hypothetical protein